MRTTKILLRALVAVAAIGFVGMAAATPVDTINSSETTKKAAGKTAQLTVDVGNTNYTRPMMVIITLYATAEYTPPNPTWFAATINVKGVGIIAKNETYADGNLGAVSQLTNTVTQTYVLPARSTGQIILSATAHGNGAASVSGTTLRVNVRTIGLNL